MLKGLRRIFGDTPRKIRRGISPQALRRAMDKLLDPKVPAHANIRAALSSAFAALLRCSEFALDNGKRWDSRRGLTRADIKELTAERAVLMTAPSKNNHHLGGKTCPVVMGAGGQFIDPVAEIANMLAVDPLPAGMDPATVPLFRDTSMGWHEPLRARSVLAVTRDLMHSVGENPEQFGTHSYRIGGASALFAAGADETVIRTMGRWSSDIYVDVRGPSAHRANHGLVGACCEESAGTADPVAVSPELLRVLAHRMHEVTGDRKHAAGSQGLVPSHGGVTEERHRRRVHAGRQGVHGEHVGDLSHRIDELTAGSHDHRASLAAQVVVVLGGGRHEHGSLRRELFDVRTGEAAPRVPSLPVVQSEL